MKTIGLIGGMSWESITVDYSLINEEVKKRLGGLHSAKCLLSSVDFAELKRCCGRTIGKQSPKAGAFGSEFASSRCRLPGHSHQYHAQSRG